MSEKKHLIHNIKSFIPIQKRNRKGNIFLDCDFSKLLTDKETFYDINIKQLYNELDSIKDKVLSSTTHKKVYYYVKYFFNKYYPELTLSFKSSSNGYRYSAFIAGTYCPFDHEICIIYMVDKAYANDNIEMTTRKWNKLKFDICEVISHELVHYAQHENSGNKFFQSKTHDFSKYIDDPNILHECNYITEDIELEAFAHTTAVEMLRYKKSPTYSRLVEVFFILHHNNVEDEVVKQIWDTYISSLKFWKKVYGITTGFAAKAV